VGLAVVAATATPAFGWGRPPKPEPAPLPAAPAALEAQGMELRWQSSLGLDEGETVAKVWLRGNLVVAATNQKRVYAVDAATGVRVWAVEAAQPHESIQAPAMADGHLYLATTTRLAALRAADGQVVASADLGFAPVGGIAAADGRAFVPDAKGWMQAVALAPDTSGWSRWAEGAVGSAPVTDAGNVYYANLDGKVFASPLGSRVVVWQHQAEGGIAADLFLTDDDLLLVPSLDYRLYALAGTSGRTLWQYNAGEPLRTAAWADETQVFLVAGQAGLTALDASNGHRQWAWAEGRTFCAADAETVWVRSRGDDLVALGRADGTVRYAVPTRPDAMVVRNETGDGVVYLATPGGRLIAAAEREASAK
jgi:serine/threonine-protein kinase